MEGMIDIKRCERIGIEVVELIHKKAENNGEFETVVNALQRMLIKKTVLGFSDERDKTKGCSNPNCKCKE